VEFDVRESVTTRGFTLIEMLLSLAIASVVMAGVFSNFISQSSQYKFQDARANAMQDLEFSLRYMVQDMQSALMLATGNELSGSGAASVQITPGTDVYSVVDPYTTFALSFRVWDTETADPYSASQRVDRCYIYNFDNVMYYDRDEPNCPPATISSAAAMLGEVAGMKVTHFKVFLDDATDVTRGAFTGIPLPLPAKSVYDKENVEFQMPGYTILLEIEVDADTGSKDAVNVFGQAVADGKQRLWRYVQLYPSVLVKTW